MKRDWRGALCRTVKNRVRDVWSVLRSLWVVGAQAFKKRETHLYPDEPVRVFPRLRGRVVLTRDACFEERCVACGLCAAACPTDCIAMERSVSSDGRASAARFRINFARCIFCGLCEEACPTSAIQLIPDFEMGEFERIDLVYEKHDLLIFGSGKDTDYDYYRVSGIDASRGPRNEDDADRFVDVKSILP